MIKKTNNLKLMEIAILRIKECEKNKSYDLSLSNLGLEILPDLQNFVRILSCSQNKITKLPEKLPNSLQILYCPRNQLTKLPEKLPNSLQVIECYDNKITKLLLNDSNQVLKSLKMLDFVENKKLDDISLILLKNRNFFCDH